MPTLDQAQQLREFAEEIHELSKRIWISQSESKAQHEAEVTDTEFLALDLLSKSQPLTVGDIQRQIGVLPAQMSRVIRSLENKGAEPLISCEINPEDKRKINVSLTPAGERVYQAYREVKLGTIRAMLGALSLSDRQELMRLLRIIREQARQGLPGGASGDSSSQDS